MENLIKETQTYYDRIRNTYHYTISSNNCITRFDSGEFEFTIPPFPYPDHQGSQIGIFSLKEFYVVKQGNVAGERASASDVFDPSGFYVAFQGLGFRPQNFTNFGVPGVATELSARQFFTVINEYGGSNNKTSTTYQRVSGGPALNMEVPVSNPSGTVCKCQVVDMDDATQITQAGSNYFSVIHFTIELIPTEISNGR